MAGRPTSCTPELLEKAKEYADGGYEEVGDLIPSIAGLACYLGVHRESLHAWNRQEGHIFSDIYRDVMQSQERKLVNGGLGGAFNPAITKMILTKHGYSDKIEQSHISPDGSMSPTRIEIVAPSDNEED
jgi:hypothetical protein